MKLWKIDNFKIITKNLHVVGAIILVAPNNARFGNVRDYFSNLGNPKSIIIGIIADWNDLYVRKLSVDNLSSFFPRIRILDTTRSITTPDKNRYILCILHSFIDEVCMSSMEILESTDNISILLHFFSLWFYQFLRGWPSKSFKLTLKASVVYYYITRKFADFSRKLTAVSFFFSRPSRDFI